MRVLLQRSARFLSSHLHSLKSSPLPCSPSPSTCLTRPSSPWFVNHRLFSSPHSSELIFAVENDDEFNDKVLSSSVPVLVDFHADWCAPCKMLGPRLEAKVAGRGGSVLLAKINVDFAADLAGDFDVRAVPTVIAFKNGNAVSKFQGVRDDEELDEFIDQLVDDQ